MHDRRVNGQTLTFGNQGALFKNAMTWWDHGSRSIWSQPWGTAIAGPMEGAALKLLPASVVPWGTWLAEHPQTTVMMDDLHRAGRFTPVVRGKDDFVIGVALQDSATAYPYGLASERRVINDRLGEHPIVVFVNPQTRDIKIYLRKVGTKDSAGASPLELEFENDGGQIVDAQTGSAWDTMRGVATQGPLKGTPLQQIPYVTSFDWAWRDFFPHSSFYPN